MGEAPRGGLLTRLWVARPWNSNPLLTGRHRFEATVCLFVALIALFAIPFVATIGTEVYATRSAAIEQANRETRSVTAVLTTAPDASAGTVRGVLRRRDMDRRRTQAHRQRRHR